MFSLNKISEQLSKRCRVAKRLYLLALDDDEDWSDPSNNPYYESDEDNDEEEEKEADPSKVLDILRNWFHDELEKETFFANQENLNKVVETFNRATKGKLKKINPDGNGDHLEEQYFGNFTYQVSGDFSDFDRSRMMLLQKLMLEMLNNNRLGFKFAKDHFFEKYNTSQWFYELRNGMEKEVDLHFIITNESEVMDEFFDEHRSHVENMALS